MRVAVLPETLLERVGVWAGAVPVPLAESLMAMLLVRTIMAGAKLGVFEALRDGPRTAPELAAAIGCDARATEKLLGALTGSGYVTYAAGRFALAPVARRWLLADSPKSLHDSLLFRYKEWDLLDQYESFVRTGKPLDVHGGWFSDDETWDLYQRGMRSLAGISAAEIAKRTPAPRDPRTLLDIGGSHGFNSVCFCRRYPNLRATILDLPQAVRHASPLLDREGMGDRVIYRPGDALTEDLGEQAWDIVFVSQLVHHFDDPTNRALVERIASALKPAGVLAIAEVERPREPGGAGQFGALMDLYFAMTSEAGTWSAEDIQSWQRDAGLEVLPPVRPRSQPGAVVVAARRAR